MSSTMTKLAAALAAAFALTGAASAQTPAHGDKLQTAAELPPQPGGPHRDPPGVLAAVPGCPQGWKPVPPGVNPALRCLPDHLVAPSSGPVRTAAPPPGCPTGWAPVSPNVNPVLRCQPANIVAARPGQAPKPPPGCPAGWRQVPPDVNAVLRCLPNQVAATPPPGTDQAGPPPGCPTGWKPVPPEVNPLMRCLPGQVVAASGMQPQRAGPDPGEPTQAMAAGGRPDLALVGSFRIGGSEMAWGTSGRLPASEAAFKKGGRCGFRYKYSTRNQGGMVAGATSNRIMRDAQNGPVLATAALSALAPGAIANSSGHVLLAPGTWMLYVHADAPMAVVESDEANNLRRVRVTVQGDC